MVAGGMLREQGVVDCKGIAHGNFQGDGTVLCDRSHGGEYVTLSKSIELYTDGN